MTKKELRDYTNLKKSIMQNEALLLKLERQAEAIPIVWDKVQMSQKEWPYIEAHMMVEAHEPEKYSRIQRRLIACRNEILRQQAEELALQTKLLEFIGALPNIRDRYIMKAVYIEERDQREIAIDLDLTEGRVSQILDEILAKLN